MTSAGCEPRESHATETTSRLADSSCTMLPAPIRGKRCDVSERTTRRPRATATSRPMSLRGGENVNEDTDVATMSAGEEDSVTCTSPLISMDGEMVMIAAVLGCSAMLVLDRDSVARLPTWCNRVFILREILHAHARMFVWLDMLNWSKLLIWSKLRTNGANSAIRMSAIIRYHGVRMHTQDTHT